MRSILRSGSQRPLRPGRGFGFPECAPCNGFATSAGTIWEITVKRAAGRLSAPANLRETVDAERFDVVAVTGGDAVAAAELPKHHRDPFDRLLIAQAQRLDALVITRDRAFGAYEVKVLPA